MTSTGKLAVILAAAAASIASLAGSAQGGPEAAVHKHEGTASCIEWWWTESNTPTTTIHWHNTCPSRRELVVSWRNQRTNTNPDDVLYGIPGGDRGVDTWPGIPVSFREL
ncbi:hypothetical protein [Nocardia sp. NPDC003963]